MEAGERTLGSRAVRLLAAIAGLILSAAVIQAAQAAPAPNWGEEHPSHSPSARSTPAMAYDSANHEMVLFGGTAQNGAQLGDTWTWDGTDWTEESPAHHPSPRGAAQMAYDSATGQMILVGGQTTQGGSSETWSWDGSDWTQLSPATPAPVAFNPSVAYDPTTATILLFGGTTADGTTLNWTWSWNGTTWTQLSPASSPTPRWGSPMAYDPASGMLVLYGGVHSGSSTDTWTWNGTTWGEVFPSQSPPVLLGGSMAYSPDAGSLIIFGGGTVAEGGRTWSWDGTNWNQLSPFAAPPARFASAMELDESNGTLLLFGGIDGGGSTLGDTWTYGIQTGQAPIATISSPVDGRTFEVGDQVPVSFSCSAATDGPPVATCVGSDGSPAPSGQLDTATIGSHGYTVTATASDGQTGSASITYEVDDPRPPACRPVPGGLTLDTFGLRPPLGDAPPVPGFRVRLAATRRVDARISPRIVYRTRSGRRSFQYRSRTVRIDRVRRLRFELPPRVRRQMFRAHGFVYGNRVTFRLRGQLKARGDRADCFGRAESLAYELPVVAVSSRVALRRR